MPRWLRRALLAIVVVSILVGLGIRPLAERFADPETRAMWLGRAGKHARAEQVWWDELQKGRVTVPIIVSFLEAHQLAVASKDIELQLKGMGIHSDAQRAVEKPEPALPENVVDDFVKRPDLPREVSLVARFLRFHEDAVRDELVAEADKRPAMPWANHVLARELLLEAKPREAAERYLAEGVEHRRKDDVESALELYESLEDWKAFDAVLRDPRAAPLTPPSMQVSRAIEARDYKRAFRYLLPFSFPKPQRGPLVLAVIAGFAWFAFCARLGQMNLRPYFRVPLYLAALALGVLSIAPTDFLIIWQEKVLHLRPNGTIVKDAIFFVMGVGFREELSKLLCFAPLIPILRRWGNGLDVLACGALVGLGFAAAENLQYFAHGDVTAAMGRFLTANFLHMSLTALASAALFRIGKSEEGFYDFTITFLTVIGLHGVYDFFLASPALGDDMSFLSMAVFFLLSRNFILEVHAARLKAGRSKPLYPTFLLGLTIVTGASFVWACTALGPALAARVMYLGLLGVAILMIVFIRQMSAL